ncbi:hypothetical protein HYH02_001352 [Chlamydomonas schloesseri]|uniref:Fungal-type protein kinase domain-containing protein n=1 Tax=Chlamydomonas schloesseri TaxID=2026947 RepID=A0A836BCD3_9CHLO|nr:hypothetical protein HYH02_001352 [Chlamydomonas schloesseri]|eukprot:KAG2454326.1 hypothetical protein HYH02_001352 [Chlamydomonas schloesseri]
MASPVTACAERSLASERVVTLYIDSGTAGVDLLETLRTLPDAELQVLWTVWGPLAARNAPEFEKAFVERSLRTSAASLGVGTAVGAAADDTTATRLRACLPPFAARTLWRGPQALRECLAERITPGLPLPASVARRLFQQNAELRGPLVSTDDSQEAASADALAAHVRHVMVDFEPVVGSEMYTGHVTRAVLEDTLRLVMRYLPGPRILMDRNRVGTSGATTGNLRPDFLAWVNSVLLLKGEEKAAASELQHAVQELTTKVSDAWAAGLLPHTPLPSMLAYAAAGAVLQFFCIEHVGSGGVQATPISGIMDLTTAPGRLQALTASFNIWRLLAGYTSQGPTAPIGMGQVVSSPDGLRTYCLLPGFFRKSIRQFSLHARYTSFKLLQELYGKMSEQKHRLSIIQACDVNGVAGPRLQQHDDTYVVHLAPVGQPCMGPPATESDLACAVLGVLSGLAALHSEGYVHRDVRWPNVIFLPAERRWLLIDLEHAGQEGCDCSKDPFPLPFWSEHTLDDGKYTAQSDLRMVAEQLMSHLSFPLEVSGQELRRRLLGDRFSAAQALRHRWLARASGR